MINEWKVKMIQKRIYKVKDSWNGEGKTERKNSIAI